MKKYFSIFVFSLAAVPVFAAASTCETRVDKHQGATTAERVEYCLTEEPAAETQDVTEVILSDVYSVQYPQPKAKKSAPQQEETKIYSKEPVSMEYLDRDDYPAFRNDILPSFSDEQAHKTAMEAIASHTETKAKTGKKSLKKPARTMKAAQPQETAPAVTDTASSYPQTATPAAAAAYPPAADFPAPSATAVQAGANTAAAATVASMPAAPAADGVPAGFDGNVLDQSNFGYNATDPAFQP